MWISYSSHPCYMSRPFPLPLLYNRIWWRVLAKLLIMQFSPPSRYYISYRSKFSSQHPVFKHPKSVSFSWYDRPSFTSVKIRVWYILIFTIFRKETGGPKILNQMVSFGLTVFSNVIPESNAARKLWCSVNLPKAFNMRAVCRPVLRSVLFILADL
jgi:hypothetical protein